MRAFLPIHMIIFSLLGACVPKGKDERHEINNPSQGVTAPEEEDPEIKELGATDPISIAGVNLIANYDNARARCDFKNTAADNYEIFCRVTIVSEFGNEYLPIRVKDGVKLTWNNPIQTRGDFLLESCQQSSDSLAFQCSGQLKSGSSALEFPLIVSEKALDRSRTEKTEVLLPFFVGVIEGDFSDTHRSYTRIPEPQAGKVEGVTDQLIQAGFFQPKIDRLDHKVNVLDACDHDDLIVMASPSYLYIYDSKKDEMKPIAGRFDENVRFSYHFEDPIRLNHQTYRVTCGKAGFTTFHASSAWDIDANGIFSSAIRTLHFDYTGKLISYKDNLTDQVTGRVAQVKTNRSLVSPGINRQRISTISQFDGDRFILIDIIKSANKIEWIQSIYLPDQAVNSPAKTLLSIDTTAGDVITPGLTDSSVLARFVKDTAEVLLYTGFCNYLVYDIDLGLTKGELGPKKTVMTAPGNCGDDTVIPGREFSRFTDTLSLFKIDSSTYRTVDMLQQIKPFSEGTFAWTVDATELLKQNQALNFDGRFPINSKVYPLQKGKIVLTNTEYLGLLKDQKLSLISANNRLRAPEVGRINNIFFESSRQKVLRIYNQTTATGTSAIIEEFAKEQFVPLAEVPCNLIVAAGTCAEYIFKTSAQSISFLVSTPGANGNAPDRTDILSFDTISKQVLISGGYPTPRSFRYRNIKGETLSSKLVLRQESQSTIMLFDASNGAVSPINLSTEHFLDSSSNYSVNDAAGTLDLLIAQTFESAASKQFSIFHMPLDSSASASALMGLVNVPAAASNNTALPFTAPTDGGMIGPNIGFQVNAKAFDLKSNLYFYYASAIYMVPFGSNKMIRLLDLESSPDCGGQTYRGESKASEVKTDIKTSMKSLCFNKTDGIFVSNGCQGKEGFIDFFIRQYYGSDSANLTLVTASCRLLP